MKWRPGKEMVDFNRQLQLLFDFEDPFVDGTPQSTARVAPANRQ
jgi:hypothetical protein